MSSFKNSVQLIGRPGMDPEVKKLSNSKLAKFSFATNDFYRNDAGELVKETSWHNIVAWNRVADKVEKIIRKGKLAALEGKLKTHSYDDKDGTKRYFTEIIVNDIVTIEKGNVDEVDEEG